MIELFQTLLEEGKLFSYANFAKKNGKGLPSAFSLEYLRWEAKVDAAIVKYAGNVNQATYYLTRANLDEMLFSTSSIFDKNHAYLLASLDTAIELIKHDLVANIKRTDPQIQLENLFIGFHSVCKQLRSRHGERSTIDINDEYDVQDLLHALLRLYFEDIRPEEWTPSYAGSSSRMDFLLKNERCVIEVKKARVGLGAKELGEQLIIDIVKYKEHPDCQTLYCFVYDPEGRVPNPIGIQNDLSSQKGDLKVIVTICPK